MKEFFLGWTVILSIFSFPVFLTDPIPDSMTRIEALVGGFVVVVLCSGFLTFSTWLVGGFEEDTKYE